MNKLYILLLLFGLMSFSYAADKQMYNSSRIEPASQEFLNSIRAEITNGFENNISTGTESSTAIGDNSDTLKKYLNRMTVGRIYGITINGTTLPMVGTNTFTYFVGQKFDIKSEHRNNYKLAGVLIPYAINVLGGETRDTSLIWVFQLDNDGNIAGGSLMAKGKIYLGDADSSSSNRIFSYAPMDSNGILNSNFLIYVQTKNFNSKETDIVAIWANDQGDGKGEKRSAILAWSQANKSWQYAAFADLKITMADKKAPDFDVLILPVLVPNTSDVIDNNLTINGLTFGGVYPNPISENARIDFSLEKSANLSISLLALNGRLVKSIANTEFSGGEHSIDFSTDDIPAAQYLIAFRSASSNFAIKTVIIK